MRREQITIIGAGPAGCAAAVQCHRLGISPLLLDTGHWLLVTGVWQSEISGQEPETRDKQRGLSIPDVNVKIRPGASVS